MAFGTKKPRMKNRRLTARFKAARSKKYAKRRLRQSGGERKYSR